MQEQIGRYEIRRELGRGGMATVYLAYDPRFKRQVAIKVLPRQFTHDPKYLARFEQEAQLIATLEHPAIVPVYDFGEDNDAPFLIMRYMAGGTLRERLNGEPLPLEVIAAMLDRLAPALDKAHQAGIIHRDIKPANILFDEDGNPYLADFGIARLAEASQTMTVVGTPAYMSPEQVEGTLTPDGRADIYALGVLLYELLTGHQPYEAETPTKQMMAHVLQPVPDILAANPDLPPGTQTLIDKTMAKDRADRYGSTSEVADAVLGLLTAQSVKGEDQVGETGPAATAVAVEKTDSTRDDGPQRIGLPVSPDEPAGGAIPPAADAAGGGRVETPLEAERKSSSLPRWAWWAGALGLLLIAIFGLRAIFGGGTVEEPITPTEASAVPAVVEETTPTPLPDPVEPPLTAGLGDTRERKADGMTMVYVPAGSFLMGSEDVENAKPVHEVRLDAFWIDRTEVTNEQFALFVEDTGYETTAEKRRRQQCL